MRNRAYPQTSGFAGKTGQAKGVVFKPETVARTFSRRSRAARASFRCRGTRWC